jgi:hypothetical protein
MDRKFSDAWDPLSDEDSTGSRATSLSKDRGAIASEADAMAAGAFSKIKEDMAAARYGGHVRPLPQESDVKSDNALLVLVKLKKMFGTGAGYHTV